MLSDIPRIWILRHSHYPPIDLKFSFVKKKAEEVVVQEEVAIWSLFSHVTNRFVLISP